MQKDRGTPESGIPRTYLKTSSYLYSVHHKTIVYIDLIYSSNIVHSIYGTVDIFFFLHLLFLIHLIFIFTLFSWYTSSMTSSLFSSLNISQLPRSSTWGGGVHSPRRCVAVGGRWTVTFVTFPYACVLNCISDQRLFAIIALCDVDSCRLKYTVFLLLIRTL